MRKIINSRLYDTDTAAKVCDISGVGGLSVTDFKWNDTWLYLSPKGTFFVAGKGNGESRWAMRVGDMRCGGDGLAVVTPEAARRLFEEYGDPEKFAGFFGEPDIG
jgi:hypothetical protein